MSEEKKPVHNRFDNIWDIRKEWQRRINEEIKEALQKPPRTDLHVVYTPSKEIVLHHSVEDFISSIHRIPIRLPAYKMLAPDLDVPSGAIYYVVEDADTKNLHIFRGTYGYGGRGCIESAIVEEYLDRRGVSLELRSPDLLMFIFA